MKWLGIIVALEAILMAFVAGMFVHSEQHTSFPASVPIVRIPQGPGGTVPLTDGARRAAGSTATAGLSTTARPARTASDSGYVGYRRVPVPRGSQGGG